ncbi:MAG: DNA-3-methyladenine glycosylase family protein [Candidatus Competibacterales bacterium]
MNATSDASWRTGVGALAAQDPGLGAWITRIGPCTLVPRRDDTPFQGLLRAIVYQQLSGRAAGAIHRRLLDLLQGEVLPARLATLDDDTLRGAGLSRSKIAAVRDLTAKTLAGVVPDRATLMALDDEAIVQRLIQVRGIGRWSAQMLLIFQLGRPDVLPTFDLGVQKGCRIVDDLDALPSPKALAQRGECWRPYRSLASWYLWRVAEGGGAQEV